MIRTELELAGEVTRVRLSSARSRMLGYSVSVFLTRGVLIDTGFPAARTAVTALLREKRPRGVLLTHGHEDHAGNLSAVLDAGLPVDWRRVMRPVVEDNTRVGPYRVLCWGRMPPVAGEPAPFAEPALQLLHTPGHSPDHHVVWDAGRETLFSADLFLGVKVRLARPGEDPRALLRSLRAAAALRPRAMWDSHRGLVPDATAALAAKAAWLEALIAGVEGRIAAGWPDAAIAREALGRGTMVDWLSFGDLSRRNLIRAIRRGAT